jgi:hypothetical protein
MLMAMP